MIIELIILALVLAYFMRKPKTPEWYRKQRRYGWLMFVILVIGIYIGTHPH